MIPYRQNRIADRVVFFVCWTALVSMIGYDFGYQAAKHVPKECAKIEGLTPISSTADECTYIIAPRGMAFYRRKAL